MQALAEGLGKAKASSFPTLGEVCLFLEHNGSRNKQTVYSIPFYQACDTVTTFYLVTGSRFLVLIYFHAFVNCFLKEDSSWCLDCIRKCCDCLQNGFTASATLAGTLPSGWMRTSSGISSSSSSRSLKVGTWPHCMGSIVGSKRQQWAHMLPLTLAGVRRLISWLTGGGGTSPVLLFSFRMEN